MGRHEKPASNPKPIPLEPNPRPEPKHEGKDSDQKKEGKLVPKLPDYGYIYLRCEHCGQHRDGTDVGEVIAMYMAHVVQKHDNIIQAARKIVVDNPNWDWRD
jgi:hypothetical protein